MPRRSSRFLISACIGALLGLILAGVALLFIPKKYECSMEIQRVEFSSELLKAPPGVMFLATEMPDGWFFQSRNSFEFVAKRLSLSVRWGMSEEDALKRLKQCVQVEPKGGRIYRIAVSSHNPGEAFEISNSLLEAARYRLTEMYSAAADRHLAHLGGEITDHSKKLVERRLILAAIPKDLDSPEKLLKELKADLLEFRREEEALVAMKRNYETRKHEAANLRDPIEVITPPTMPKGYIQPRMHIVLIIGTTAGILMGFGFTFFPAIRRAAC